MGWEEAFPTGTEGWPLAAVFHVILIFIRQRDHPGWKTSLDSVTLGGSFDMEGTGRDRQEQAAAGRSRQGHQQSAAATSRCRCPRCPRVPRDPRCTIPVSQVQESQYPKGTISSIAHTQLSVSRMQDPSIPHARPKAGDTSQSRWEAVAASSSQLSFSFPTSSCSSRSRNLELLWEYGMHLGSILELCPREGRGGG